MLQALSSVPDPRNPRGLRYPLATLLSVAVCAVMTGASSVTAVSDWLHDLDDIARARLGFVRGAPATTTMWRLLIRLDADLLATILAAWLRTRTQPAAPRRRRYRQVIAIDGKRCGVPAAATGPLAWEKSGRRSCQPDRQKPHQTNQHRYPYQDFGTLVLVTT